MKILSNCSDLFWKIVGNTKVFRYPLWFVYDPDQPKVDGARMFKVMSVLQPGDILMRGWRHYLNGKFIPGDYSHGGLYAGDNTVIHAVPEGVVPCNLLDFINADRICILRPVNPNIAPAALALAKDFADRKTPYDFKMTEGQDALYCFELCAECYKFSTDIKKVQPSLFGGLIKRREPAWLSASFLSSNDFFKVFEFNPDKGITDTPA